MKARNRLSNLDVSFVSLVSRAAVRDPANPTQPQRFILTKSEVPVVDMTSGSNPRGGEMPQTEAELRAALQKAEQERDQARGELKKARKASNKASKNAKPKPTDQNPDPDHDGDDDRTAAGDTDHDYHPAGGKMSKSEREELKKADERIRKAEVRAEAAEKIAKEERDRRVRGEFVELAKADLPHLGDATDVGAEIHRLSEVLSKEEFDAHLARQRAANEQIAKGSLFAQFGVDGDGRRGAQDAKAKLEKAAEDLRKADSSLTAYQARAEALRRNPELLAAGR